MILLAGRSMLQLTYEVPGVSHLLRSAEGRHGRRIPACFSAKCLSREADVETI
jgi:hypothetical protein